MTAILIVANEHGARRRCRIIVVYHRVANCGQNGASRADNRRIADRQRRVQWRVMIVEWRRILRLLLLLVLL